MGCGSDQWTKDWLDEQCRQGRTGLTVEKRGGSDLRTDRAGNSVMVCSREMDPKDVYRPYGPRRSVEGSFDSAKNALDADRAYMRDDAHVMDTCSSHSWRFW